MNRKDFAAACWMALNLEDEVPEWEDPSLSEVVETHEPIENFRPVDVMSGKMAGQEISTKFGPVVVRKGVQKHKGAPRQTMYLATADDGVTLVGWE